MNMFNIYPCVCINISLCVWINALLIRNYCDLSPQTGVPSRALYAPGFRTSPSPPP